MPRVAAATMPMIRPKTTQSTAAPITSDRVTGMVSITAGTTFQPRLTKEVRSPVMKIFFIMVRYWTYMRLIEAEALAHGFENFGRGIAPGDASGRVGAGRREEDQEHQHADAEHHEGHLAKAAKQGVDHQPRPILILERGSSASRRPSPSTLSARTVMTMAIPGASATSGRV